MLEDLQIPERSYNCKVEQLKEELSPSDHKILLDAVMNPAWTQVGLQSALREKGIILSASTIKRHRTKVCSCWKI